MSPDAIYGVIIGLAFGYGLGHLTKWRTDRKLEHHGVTLADWDRPIDLKAPRPAKVITIEERFTG